MKRISLIAILLLSFVLTSYAQTTQWDIDPAHANAQFSVRHLMVSNVRGELAKVTRIVNLDEKNITQSNVETTIDVRSLNRREPRSDAHLKSADFFDVEEFPTIAFESAKIVEAGETKLKLVGNLTIKGITREVVLDV